MLVGNKNFCLLELNLTIVTEFVQPDTNWA